MSDSIWINAHLATLCPDKYGFAGHRIASEFHDFN